MLPDLGWTELLVIAIVLIVVVGPDDLPRVLRGFSKQLGSLRKMAGDFRKQFDDALSESELDELKTLAKDVKSMDPRSSIKDALNPLGKVGQEIGDELKGVKKSIEDGGDAENSIRKPITPEEAFPQLVKARKDKEAAEAAAKKEPTKKAPAKTNAKVAAKPKAVTTPKKATATKAAAAKKATPAKKPVPKSAAKGEAKS